MSENYGNATSLFSPPEVLVSLIHG